MFTCLPEHSALWRLHHVPWLWSPFAAWHKARSGRSLETQWAAQWRTNQGKQPFYQLKLFFICPEITPLRQNIQCSNLTKQPTFCKVTNGFPAKCRLKNKHRNCILIKCHYPDLGRSGSVWLVKANFSRAVQPIRSTTQIWVHVIRMKFRRETVVAVAKCRLFSQYLCSCS